jgi:hypothetical protein
VNATNDTTVESDFQTCNCLAEADEFLAAAIDRIGEGLRKGSTGAEQTCRLILNMLEGTRVPIRRLGGLR